jgi:hypothetical protein
VGGDPPADDVAVARFDEDERPLGQQTAERAAEHYNRISRVRS